MSVTKARSRVANTVKNKPNDLEAVSCARRDLAAAKLAAYIKKTVDAAPPLTAAQIDELSILFRRTPNGGAEA